MSDQSGIAEGGWGNMISGEEKVGVAWCMTVHSLLHLQSSLGVH